MADKELKEMVEEGNRAITALRESHEAELKKHDAITEEKITRIETDLSKSLKDAQDKSDAAEAKAKALEEKLDAIFNELNASKGQAKDIGGYYRPDTAKVATAMRPSATFNELIDNL